MAAANPATVALGATKFKGKRRRSTVKTFALLQKIHNKEGEDEDVDDGKGGTRINTATNLPYAVLNLAEERHNNRHNTRGSESAYGGGGGDDDDDDDDTSQKSKKGARKQSFWKQSRESVVAFPEAVFKSASVQTLNSRDMDDSDVHPAVAGAEDRFKGNQAALAYQNWIENALHMHPSCIHPVRSKKKPAVCECGRAIDESGPHAVRTTFESGLEPRDNASAGDYKRQPTMHDVVTEAAWCLATHTLRTPTTSYGLVTFRPPPAPGDADKLNYKLLRTAKPYVRVSSQDCLTSPGQLKEMLVNKWDLEPPRIMLAVTGGAQSFDLPPKLDTMLKKGLARAAEAESLWITTGGTNSGVMKYVAAAVAESDSFVPVIGFLPWSVVSQKEVLDTYPDGDPVQGGMVYYGNPDKQPIGLDRNHTHFVMVDDGTAGKFGGDIASKTSIESSVAEGLSVGKFGSESPISTVLLAIQGGPGTVSTVLACLKQATPVVIVNGSGKASNVIAYAIGLPLPGERPLANGHTMEGLEQVILNEFECHESSPMFSDIKKKCLECISKQYREFIHIYTVDFSGVDDGLAVTLDVALLQAVLDHDKKQWTRHAAKLRKANARLDLPKAQFIAKEVEDRIRMRDLARGLRLELALMWNRIEVVKQEVSQYCVLPQLGKRTTAMLYKTKHEVKMHSRTKTKVVVPPGTEVELLKIMGPMWLVRTPAHDQGWITGNAFKKIPNKPTFADTVILAQLRMLKWLFLEEKLDFVQLFLQGMRTEDVRVFLSLRERKLWHEAAKFDMADHATDELDDHTIDEPDDDPVAQQKAEGAGGGKARGGNNLDLNELKLHLAIDRGRKIRDGAGDGQRPRSKSQDRWVTTFAKLKQTGKIKNRSERTANAVHARQLLKKNQEYMFDESDVPPTPHVTLEWKAHFSDALFRCWVRKKWAQHQDGFTMSEKTLAIIRGGKERKEPRDISLSQLPLFKQQEWLDQAEMFVKMLRSSGYIVSKCRGGYNQRDKFGGITRIYDHALLVESMARMRHSAWLQKKLEDRWVCETEYDDLAKASPYVRLYTKLTEVEREHICETVVTQLQCLLKVGFWIWKPDMLESCYFESACKNHRWPFDSAAKACNLRTNNPALNIFTDGQFWRSRIQQILSDFVGPRYTMDFSTFGALNPYFHLMIWAVITKRFVLAEFFWRETKADLIINALVMALVCEELAKGDRVKHLTPEVKNQFVDFQDTMQEHAEGLLRMLRNVDASQTRQLLCAQYPTIGWMRLWELSHRLRTKGITSQDLYIDVIQQEWHGRIDQQTGFLKIMFGIVFPPYVALHWGGGDEGLEEQRSSTFASTAAVLTVVIDDTELDTTPPPTIRWSPTTERVTITANMSGCKVFYTLDGTDPRSTGTEYVAGRKKSVWGTPAHAAKAGGGGPGGKEASSINLLELGQDMVTIRAIAVFVGTGSSADAKHRAKLVNPHSIETAKVVNCAAKDLVSGTIPEFTVGPSEGKGHWAKHGVLGRIAYRYHCFYAAPYVTFWSDLLYNIFFVLLYSYSTIVPTVTMDKLVAFNTYETGVPLLVFCWTGMLMTDEARQAVSAGLEMWWSDVWNKLDFVQYVNATMCIILRLKYADTTHENDRLRAARILYALGALMLWVRTGRLYALSPKLGPKLVMIGLMIQDVLIFMALLMVVLIGYGVAMHAILEPYRTFDAQSLNTIFFKPMFAVIGDAFLGEIQSHTQCLGEDFTQCDDNTASYIIVFMLFTYLIITNVMLVNLLIAMMAATYDSVEKDSQATWSLQNVDLLEEFRELLPLPPPISALFNVFDGLIHTVRRAFKLCFRKTSKAAKQKAGSGRVGPGDEGGDSPQGNAHIPDMASYHANSGTIGMSEMQTADHATFVEERTHKYFDDLQKKNAVEVAQRAITDLINFKNRALEERLENLEFGVKQQTGMLVEAQRGGLSAAEHRKKKRSKSDSKDNS